MTGSQNADQIPPEFMPEKVRANSPQNVQLYHDFHSTAEPAKSMARLGFAFKPDKSSPSHLNFNDESHYYNSGAEAQAYWADQDLPRPTKDIHRMRHDLKEWGYCLVHDALSPAQLEVMHRRLWEQSEGEKAAGIALWLNSSAKGANTQFIGGMVNKGRCFEDFLEHNPRSVQAGPLMEQLIREACGGEFIITSMLAIIAYKDGFPQALHQDQHMQFQDDAPMGINQMIMLVDVSPLNGGTLVVPGSHRILAAAGSGKPVEMLPPPINVTAPAGTALLWDTRLLHGMGVNRTDKPRYCIVAQGNRSHLRQQENFALSVAPEVLRRASDKLLFRMGLQGSTSCAVEGDGLGAPGRIGDEIGNLKLYREAMDRGHYVRVGELAPSMPDEQLMAPFTYRLSANGRRAVIKAKKFGLLPPDRLAKATELSTGGLGEEALSYKKRGKGTNAITAKL